MHRLTFPKNARLLKRKQFIYVQRSGHCCRTGQATLRIIPSRKAYQRNRFKRIVREAFRHVRADLPGCQVVVSPKGNTQPNFLKLSEELLRHIPETLSLISASK